MPFSPTHATRRTLLGLLKPTSPLLEAAADAGIGSFELDLRTGDALWSAELLALFDLEPAEQVHCDDLRSRVHPDDAAAFQAAFDRAVASIDAAGNAAYAADYRIIRPNGAVRWLSTRGRVVRTASGEGDDSARLVGVVVDETARRQAEAALADSDRRRDAFLPLLAHDLRNPLSPLHTAAELMRRAEMQPARIVSLADMLTRQVSQMAHLIDDLVDVSRANQGRIALHRHTVGLQGLIEKSVEAMKADVGRRRQFIETTLGEPDAIVDVDPDRFGQIIKLLIEHASRSSLEDGVIRVAATMEGGDLVLSVSDDGAGIDAARLHQAFDLYPSLEGDPSRRQLLGTGLALVKALALLHGGSVDADSAGAGQGSRYTVRLPISPASTTA